MIGSFTVRTLMQIGEHSRLVLRVDSPAVYVRSVSDTRIKDSSRIIQLVSRQYMSHLSQHTK